MAPEKCKIMREGPELHQITAGREVTGSRSAKESHTDTRCVEDTKRSSEKPSRLEFIERVGGQWGPREN